MMKLIYSFIIVPLLVLFSHLLAIFSKRIRKPILLRYNIINDLKKWRNEQYSKDKKVIVIHSSSMGEFEHIKPLIIKIKEIFLVNIIVTFFSPSGYENVRSFPGVDLFLYLPFDFSHTWKKFYKLTETDLLIISKHDVWPNQIKVANKLNIKTILVNASLNEKSSRNAFFARLMLSTAYNSLDKIFVISEQDGLQFEKSFNCRNFQVSGDTKFDQVHNRKKESIDLKLISGRWLADNLILVLGSLWPQDAEHILTKISKVLENFDNFKIVLAPHQPTEEQIEIFSEYFKDYKYSLYSESYENDKTRLLIINKIGVLADIYKHGHVAYVGGSFKQGIHNVMEPAVYGLPVIYGPFHRNSYEAKKLLKKGGSIIIDNSDDFNKEVSRLIEDEALRKSIGKKAFDYVNKSSGGTEKILEYVGNILN